jgi:hypothetical protein
MVWMRNFEFASKRRYSLIQTGCFGRPIESEHKSAVEHLVESVASSWKSGYIAIGVRGPGDPLDGGKLHEEQGHRSVIARFIEQPNIAIGRMVMQE